jgi:hypothetical protein
VLNAINPLPLLPSPHHPLTPILNIVKAISSKVTALGCVAWLGLSFSQQNTCSWGACNAAAATYSTFGLLAQRGCPACPADHLLKFNHGETMHPNMLQQILYQADIRLVIEAYKWRLAR